MLRGKSHWQKRAKAFLCHSIKVLLALPLDRHEVLLVFSVTLKHHLQSSKAGVKNLLSFSISSWLNIVWKKKTNKIWTSKHGQLEAYSEQTPTVMRSDSQQGGLEPRKIKRNFLNAALTKPVFAWENPHRGFSCVLNYITSFVIIPLSELWLLWSQELILTIFFPHGVLAHVNIPSLYLLETVTIQPGYEKVFNKKRDPLNYPLPKHWLVCWILAEYVCDLTADAKAVRTVRWLMPWERAPICITVPSECSICKSVQELVQVRQ